MIWAFALGLVVAGAEPGETPRAVVTTALHAVERDSVSAAKSRFESRIAAAPTDRLARLGLATLERFQDHPGPAREIYRRLLAERADDPVARYARIGLAWVGLGRESLDSTHARSVAAAAESVGAGDSLAVVETLVLAAFASSRLGPQPPALDTVALAERWIPAGSSPAILAQVRCTAAPIMTFSGRPGGLAAAREGVALATRARDHRIIGFCYHSLAIVAANDIDDEAIITSYADSALVHSRLARDGWMVALESYTKGYVRYIFFDLGGAKQALADAVVLARTAESKFAAAWAHRFLSNLYAQAGDLAAAEQEFHVAEALFGDLQDGMGLGNLQSGRAAALVSLGRLNEAEQIYRAGLARTQRNQLGEGIYHAYQSLADLDLIRGRWEGAVAWLDSARTFGLTHARLGWIASLEWDYGLAALGRGDLDRSEQHFRRYLASSGPEQFADHYSVRTRLADIAARRGNLTLAAAELHAAADRLDSLRASLTDDQLKLLVFQTRVGSREPDAGFARVAAQLVRGGRAREVLDLAERRRGRALADRLLRSAYLTSDGKSAVELRGRLVRRPGEPLPALDDSTAVLEFVAGTHGQPSSVLVVTRRGVSGYVLPTVDSLAPIIGRLEALLERGAPGDAPARLLQSMLLDSAMSRLDPAIRRLVVVPDDVLHRVPFDALIMPNGEPLVRRFAVSRSPSFGLAAGRPSAPAAARGSGILALGDPEFADERNGGNPDTELFREGFAATGGLERLEASGDEAAAVARFSRTSVLRLRSEASEAFLKRASLGGFRVIHFATHALVDRTWPSRSALALSPGEGEDGFVGAAELAALELDADLVVLSACRSAGGAVIGGEGVQGLTAPLLAAGARAVLATLWRVPDRSTGRFVESFYRELARGNRAGDALRAAQLAAFDRGEPQAVWAAFTLVGDWSVRPA